MMDGEEKTRIINGMSKSIEDLVGSKENGGWLVVFIHSILTGLIFYQTLGCNSKIEVGMGAIIWLALIASNLMFDGCMLVRIERELFESKEWYNVWNILFILTDFFGYPLSHKTYLPIKNITGLIVTIIILWRFYYVCTKDEIEEKK